MYVCFDYFCRIANGYAIGWNIFGNYCAATNHYFVADMYAGHNDSINSDDAIRTDISERQ